MCPLNLTSDWLGSATMPTPSTTTTWLDFSGYTLQYGLHIYPSIHPLVGSSIDPSMQAPITPSKHRSIHAFIRLCSPVKKLTIEGLLNIKMNCIYPYIHQYIYPSIRVSSGFGGLGGSPKRIH